MRDERLLLTLVLVALLCVLLTKRVRCEDYTSQSLADKLLTLGVNSPNIGRIEFSPLEVKDVQGWNVGMLQKFTSREGWRCSDYADTLFVFAKSRDIKACIGVIWFYIHPKVVLNRQAHAVNVFISKDGAFRFYDPSTQREVSLTKDQIDSIYFCLF